MKKSQKFWTMMSGSLLAIISGFWGCIDCIFFFVLFVFLLDILVKENKGIR